MLTWVRVGLAIFIIGFEQFVKSDWVLVVVMIHEVRVRHSPECRAREGLRASGGVATSWRHDGPPRLVWVPGPWARAAPSSLGGLPSWRVGAASAVAPRDSAAVDSR